MKTLFLHGLDSSSNGTKARFFREHFPDTIIPDFSGSLEMRLQKLEEICDSWQELTLIGSSFGGLMATCYAAEYPDRVKRLILMAPALNFPGFLVPKIKIPALTYILIGSNDDVTPPDKVLPLAELSFAHLETHIAEEDHLLHNIFPTLDWHTLLG